MPHIDLKLSDLPPDIPLRVEHAGTAIVVIRSGDTVTAFHDSCPHAGWRLSEGEISNGVLECPGHSWEFDTATGRCLTVPAHRLRPVGVVRIGDRIRLAWAEVACAAASGG